MYLLLENMLYLRKKKKLIKCLIILNGRIISHLFMQVIEPEKISKDAVKLVHREDYVDRFFSGQTSSHEQKMTGFPWSEQLVDRCRYETGQTKKFLY